MQTAGNLADTIPVELLDLGPVSARRARSIGLERWPAAVALAVVAAVSLLFGGATSVAQGLLPAPWAPLANSASSWTLVAVVLVRMMRRKLTLSMLLGVIAFVGLVLGYTLVSNLRGYYYSPWLVVGIGVVAGLPLGAAAAAVRGSGRCAAAGAGLVAGVLLGDSVWGLTQLVSTTGWAYWAGAGLLGIGLLVRTVLLLRPRLHTALAALPTATVVALLLNLAYARL